MKTQKLVLLLTFFICFVIHPSIFHVHSKLLSIFEYHERNNTKEMEVYIVYVQKPQGTKFLRFKDRVSWYNSFLPNSTLDSGKPRMIYAYRHAISGFAARLTAEEVKVMEKMEGFVLAHPESNYKPMTTYSPSFLGLSKSSGLWPDSYMGQGQVIGVIDSGIIPTHPSFRDDGSLPTPPQKWKGKCYWGQPICNNKLIGAQGFKVGKYIPPLDNNGHGTHCAGIAAGTFVEDASVLGQGKGTASGMAPKAHLAVYKTSKIKYSKGSDTLKALDEAIRDHVDIISISLGNEKHTIYNSDIAVAGFAAVTKGIVPVVCSGNSGPVPSVQDNDAPWLLTVGGSNMDRRVVATVTLGNGKVYTGEGTFEAAEGFTTGQLPLIYPGAANTPETLACQKGSFDNLDVTGKIVLCVVGNVPDSEKTSYAKSVGAAGVILLNPPTLSFTTNAVPHEIPTVNINFDDTWELAMEYLPKDPKLTAAISYEGTMTGYRPAPTVYTLSSRGPSLRNGNIIKPDIIAPGVNILAAWPDKAGKVGADSTGETKTFAFATGTSMATPHVAGIVALLRNTHPNWSPAEIKSAIMTTAYVIDKDGNPIKDDHNYTKASVFAMGSGHVDPVAANDPGLVYDIKYHDYIAFLCGSGFNDKQVSAIVRGKIKCSTISKMDSDQLNYPSISLSLGSAKSTRTVKRTMKNVGDDSSEYTVKFEEPDGVTMDVNPSTLKFSQVGQELSYEVTFGLRDGFTPIAGLYSEGYLAWDSGKYFVRSPIAVRFT